jgi:hypothetical protein
MPVKLIALSPAELIFRYSGSAGASLINYFHSEFDARDATTVCCEEWNQSGLEIAIG